MSNDLGRVNVRFSAINEKIVDKIPSNVVLTGSSKYALWGLDNKYPNFLYDCYLTCPTLQSILNGYVDYILGNNINSQVLPKPNPNESWQEFISHLASDYVIFGVCYIQVIRNKAGQVSELYWLDSRFVRVDEDEQAYWYNEDFAKKYVRTSKTLVYPKFIKDSEFPASVLSIKTPFSRGCYGTPIWGSAIKDVQVEIGITDYHFSELENNFAGNTIINFNAGIPTEEQQDELEKLVAKKFAGHQNAGRFLLSFNNGVDNATTIEKLSTDDLDKRYVQLKEKTTENIYAGLRANPQLFGLVTKTGFSTQDYQEAYKIFQRTVIQPIQQRIVDGFDRIFGVVGSIVIEQFSIDFGEDETDNNNNNNNNGDNENIID